MPGSPAFSPKRAARLKAKKYRESERLFLAEGTAFLEEAPVTPVRVFDAEEQILRVSTLKTPAGPVGIFDFLDVTVAELLSSAQRVVLLQGVQDPGNVGTAIRSAHAFGAGVALSRGCADLYNPKTVRASMGSIFHAPVAREVESVQFLRAAKDAGFATVAAMPDATETPKSIPAEPVVLCIGNEGEGLSEEVVDACGMRVGIASFAPSLNASVAASILLYEAYSRVLP
jgi:TrmH family RNA methyltransferase